MEKEPSAKLANSGGKTLVFRHLGQIRVPSWKPRLAPNYNRQSPGVLERGLQVASRWPVAFRHINSYDGSGYNRGLWPAEAFSDNPRRGVVALFIDSCNLKTRS